MHRVPSKPNVIELEEHVLRAWEEEQAFEVLKRQVAGRPLFRFIDGPITANNPMGVHHAWGRTLKDAFIRQRVMSGFDCRFQNGFDCQGLWVEVEVEKALGFNGKPDIERFGLDRFSAACKDRVLQFADVIADQSKRLGQWMDWSDSYYTYTDANITGIWHFLKICAEKGWIYQKGLPMPWCPRCGTSLSEHEMAGSHKDVTHLSIFGMLPLKSDPTRRLLIWTTTPWTLSSNVAAAVNPELDYIEVRAPGWNHTLILCEGAKKALAGTGAQIERRFKGSELVGLEYETFHPDFAAQQGLVHRVVPWEMVSADEGSGIVHIAPGCGREDYELGQRLGLAQVVPVDDNGTFFEGFGFLTGQKAQDAARLVADALAHHGKLFKAEDFTHSYPVCWRCKGELIFRLVKEWFIRCDEIRPQMKAAAAQVQWSPEFIGKRMDNWLDQMGDWCISRKRYWGLPLPFYVCEGCGTNTVIGSLAELRAHAVDPGALDRVPELHRPWIDEVLIRCPTCAAAVPRVPEVGDCWLDAGIVPYSTTGYFDDKAAFERAYPAEWVCEMREQVRLWFYSMLFMGTAISGRAPYEKVLAYERVISEDGQKFSKTGYMIRFDEAVRQMGADAMRWLYCRQPVTSDVRFGWTAGEVAQRKLASLWNIYGFFATYALIDRPDPTLPLDPDALTVSDRWLLARTAELVETATAGFAAWDTPRVCEAIEAWLDDASNWYVRINRHRFWKAEQDADKAAAYGVLYRALKTVVLVLAPIAPFMTDAIWRNVVRSLEPDAPGSVHHAAWPKVDATWWVDRGVLGRTAQVRSAISLALNLRERASLRVRQPLPRVYLTGDEGFAAAIAEQRAVVAAELNVKEVVVASGGSAFTDAAFALDFKAAGPVLRKDANAFKERLAALTAAEAGLVAARIDSGATEVEVPGWPSPIPVKILIRREVARAGVEVASEGGITVALDTALTPALVREGLVRDLQRKIQSFRKDSGLEVEDRVRLWLATSSPELALGLEEHATVLAEDVLAVDVWIGDDVGGATRHLTDGALIGGVVAWDLLGHPVTCAIARAE